MGRHVQNCLLLIIVSGVLGFAPAPLSAQPGSGASVRELTELAREFDGWLILNQPVSTSAALRLARPDDWNPDWSQPAMVERKAEYRRFQSRQKSLNTLGYQTPERVDQVMLGARMERIHWQLELLGSPRRDPGFYLDQGLGGIYEILVESPEPGPETIEALIHRFRGFPELFNTAKLMLDRVVPELAHAAIEKMGEVEPLVESLQTTLDPIVSEAQREAFELGIRAASQSLISYRDWLTASLPRFSESMAIGEPRLRWYLGHVALIPRSPQSILVESRMTLDRVGASLALAREQAGQSSSASPFDSIDRLVQMSGISLGEIETYLERSGLISSSEDAPSFELGEFPPALLAISEFGEPMVYSFSTDKPARRYMFGNGKAPGFIDAAASTDPRLLLTWYANPGLQQQFWRASGHQRIIRNKAISPTLSVGLALYFHEQLTQAGLYSLKPASFRLALGVTALHAALAHADVQVALGEWNEEEAAHFLMENCDLTAPEALREVRRLIANPGAASAQFASYSQTVRFLSDASREMGDEFSLSAFNDRLLLNAHVPIALQRWEYLDLDDELDVLIDQRGRPVTVPE